MQLSGLTQLLQSGEYRKCLQEATELLQEGNHDAATAARIHAAICKSNLELTAFFAAVESGQQAVSLAEDAGLHDLLGFSLLDLASAQGRIRQFDEALKSFERFLDKLPEFTAARCMEGTVLRRLASTLHRLGRSEEARERYWEAQHWFDRFGDDRSAADCVRSLIRIALDEGEPEYAAELLLQGQDYIQAHPTDRDFLAGHLLDRSLYHLVMGNHNDSIQEAFRALEVAEGLPVQQCRAQLILSQNALATGRPKDALNFALGARVTAIDGKLYDLEFEASDILFRVLRERGARLIKELESDYYEHGVDIFHYVSDRVVSRMLHEEE